MADFFSLSDIGETLAWGFKAIIHNLGSPWVMGIGAVTLLLILLLRK